MWQVLVSSCSFLRLKVFSFKLTTCQVCADVKKEKTFEAHKPHGRATAARTLHLPRKHNVHLVHSSSSLRETYVNAWMNLYKFTH